MAEDLAEPFLAHSEVSVPAAAEEVFSVEWVAGFVKHVGLKNQYRRRTKDHKKWRGLCVVCVGAEFPFTFRTVVLGEHANKLALSEAKPHGCPQHSLQ